MSESDAVLRREARRKRILENSENRLRKIVGTVSDDPQDLARPSSLFSSSTVVHDSCDLPSALEKHVVTSEENEISGFDKPFISKPLEQEASKIKYSNGSLIKSIVEKRVHYILLAVVVQILLTFNMGFLFYENIICPFYTFKILEFFVTRQERQNVQPNVIMLLSGFSAGVALSLQKAYQFITTLSADFFLYIFSFILSTTINVVVQ